MLALGLSACASRGVVENPVARSLTWFGYAGGEDVRAGCAAGAPERYRFVYNGVWGEQVRTYDLVASAAGEGAVLIVRVFGGASLTRLELDDPFAPWRGAAERTGIDEDAFREAVQALDASGYRRPPRVGLRLDSDDYYWLVSGCRDGRFHLRAWIPADGDLAAVPFVAPLLRHDPTGVAFRPPRPGGPGPYARADDPRWRAPGGSLQRFWLQIGADGLVLGPRPF